MTHPARYRIEVVLDGPMFASPPTQVGMEWIIRSAVRRYMLPGQEGSITVDCFEATIPEPELEELPF